MLATHSHPLPPDRGHLLTEAIAVGKPIDQLNVTEAVAAMNAADQAAVDAVAQAGPQIAQAVERIVAAWRAGGRLIYIGAGTSGRLGVLDASECPPTFQSDPRLVVGVIAGGDVALRKSVEDVEDRPDDGAADLEKLHVSAPDCVVGIAAGGTTPYVHGALQYAQKQGAGTVFLTCVPDVEAAADITIRVLTGPEVLTGSTRLKAGTATKLVLNMLTTISFAQMGKVYHGLMVDMNARINTKLVDRAMRVIGRLTGLSREKSRTLLDSAEGQVKTALVMHFRHVSCKEAVRLLQQADGRLEAVLDKATQDKQ